MTYEQATLLFFLVYVILPAGLITFIVIFYRKFFFLTQEVRVLRKILENQFGKITKKEYLKYNYLTKEDQEAREQKIIGEYKKFHREK